MNKSKQTPGTNQSTTNSTYGKSGTTQRILTDEQGEGLGILSSVAKDRIQNPGARLAPIREAMRSGVNQNFAGADAALKAKLGRGDGRSGVMGKGQREMETSRAQALTGVDSQIAQMVLQEQDAGVGMMERLLSQIFGSTTSESGQNTGTTTGQYTQPMQQTNPWGAGVGGGLDTLMTLMTLNKMMQGNANGGTSYPS